MEKDFPYFTPLVLLIEGHEWTARSFESILAPQGCALFKAYTGEQGLDILRRLVPDLVLVDRHLPDMTGYQVLRQLREVPSMGRSTPRVMLSVKPIPASDRLAALEEGAWEVLTPPFDPVELRLRAKNWIEIKRDGDRARETSLIDPLTGLYNYNGLLRRVDEVLSDAIRNERDLALVALGPDPEALSPDPEGDADQLSRTLAQVVRQIPRLGDAVARVGPAEFIILAPGTDQDGAEALVRRLVGALQDRVKLQAGIYATRGLRKQSLNPIDVLNRASQALRRAQTDPRDAPLN